MERATKIDQENGMRKIAKIANSAKYFDFWVACNFRNTRRNVTNHNIFRISF